MSGGRSSQKKSVKYARIREIIDSVSKKGKLQRKIVSTYLQQLIVAESMGIAKARAERLMKTSATLTTNEKFSPTGYWKIKKAANKGTRKEQVLSSVVKENGVEVDGEQAVIEAYLEEFDKRLANRKPATGWETYTDEKMVG